MGAIQGLSSTAKRAGRLGLLCVVLVGASLIVAPASATAGGAAEGTCNEGTGKPALDLTWKGLPGDDDEITPTGSVVQLRVENRLRQTVFVDLSVAAVLDARRETVSLGMVVIGPGARTELPLDLAALGMPPALLDFSGRVAAHAVARLDQGAPVHQVAYAPHIFFHLDGAQMVVYRRGAMLARHDGGDYANRGEKLRRWIADRGLKLRGIGYYGRGLDLTDDDGGPPDPTGDPNGPRRLTAGSDASTHHHADRRGTLR
ncbi:MAG: hypothetical protein AAGC60_10165 [Acidobacteriota bacterium]